MNNINRVVLTGNLTADPDLRSTPERDPGVPACGSPATPAVRENGAREWVDKPNYFNVTVWGGPGRGRLARYLSKGRPVRIDRHLEWREWEAQDGSRKRQAVGHHRRLRCSS